jgi:uncharacterized membrane protein
MLWFVAMIFVLLIMGAIALVAFLVMRQQPAVPVAFPGARETPLQILDRRFASGEITAEDYKKGRDILNGGGAP